MRGVTISKIKPNCVVNSLESINLSSDLNSVHGYMVNRGYRLVYDNLGYHYIHQNSRDYVYVYRAQKFNTKKKWTGKYKKDKTTGLKKKEYMTVTKAHVVLSIYKFKKSVVSEAAQRKGYFRIEVSL